MPGPFDRHSRPDGCCERYGSQPPRSQLRQAAVADDSAAARRSPGRKDKSLCKAAHWRGPHQPEFRLVQGRWSKGECHWGISWTKPEWPSWVCHHDERCAGCGRVLRTLVPAAECPDFRPITGAERAAIEAEIEYRRNLYRTPSRTRRPIQVITGPQGYRRAKPGAATFTGGGSWPGAGGGGWPS